LWARSLYAPLFYRFFSKLKGFLLREAIAKASDKALGFTSSHSNLRIILQSEVFRREEMIPMHLKDLLKDKLPKLNHLTTKKIDID
jgi:hypothetical protein